MPDLSAGPVGDLPPQIRASIEHAIRDAADECSLIADDDESENSLRFIDFATDGVLAVALPLIRAHIADELHEEAQNVRPDSTREWLTHWLGAALRGGTDA